MVCAEVEFRPWVRQFSPTRHGPSRRDVVEVQHAARIASWGSPSRLATRVDTFGGLGAR